MMMNEFMAMLKKNENEHPPPTELLNLAEQLCRNLESSSSSLEQLVEAMMECRNKKYFLTNIHVVRACVYFHIHKGQRDAACRLVEYCNAEEKEELVKLWHEIHYRSVMEKQGTGVLTALQKFRSRKRNPPPISLCPEGLKSRNYSEQVRQKLLKFAVEVTANPNKKQREALARSLNLQPIQVYNWFANYRRRQKSHHRGTKKSNKSRPKTALASHKNDPKNQGSNTPQTADGSCVGIGPEQMEITLLPCKSEREQSAAPLYQPPEGSYLKMLQSSCVQSPELCEAGTSTALFNIPKAEQPVPSGTGADMQAGTSIGSPVLLPAEAATSAAASPWQGSFVLYSNESHPFLNNCLPKWTPYSTIEVCGSVWTPGIEAGVRAPLSTVLQGGYVEVSSEKTIQQSDLQDESLTFRGGQLGTLEPIPHSSPQIVFDKPQCPPVHAPNVEGSQALGQSQVRKGPVDDDMYEAACLLCEFSESGHK